MKKLVSLILALALVLSVMSFATVASAEDYVKLTWVQGNSPAPKDNDMVLEELNKISREKRGVECEIIYMTSTSPAAGTMSSTRTSRTASSPTCTRMARTW